MAGWEPSPSCLLRFRQMGDPGPEKRDPPGTDQRRDFQFAAPGDFKEQNWGISLHKIHLPQIPSFT